jgi:hypothetical protein
MKPIPINIWDDYHEDGHIPEGEIQETYIYVEDYNIPHDSCRYVLDRFMKFIKNNLRYDNVEMRLEFYDSKVKYPDYPGLHYQRWEIKVKHLTHQQREYIVDILYGVNLNLDGIPIRVYSES